MARYAIGRHAIAICDRCGLQWAYLALRKEWTGWMVCPECFEERHPQDFPPRAVADAEALRDARPDVKFLHPNITVGADAYLVTE